MTRTIVDVPAAANTDTQMATIIGEAFADLAVSKYLIPDDNTRAAVLARHLGIQVPLARQQGALLTDNGGGSVSVWFHVTADGLADIEDYEAMRAAACGDNTNRFAEFEARMDANHPHGRDHWYLALMAVLPLLQGNGLGTAHLQHQLAIADKFGQPAYLEAADTDSRALYARHGFVDHGQPFACGPDGPLLYPMWREPKTAA